MGYSRRDVENILKTLPIGYYIKRGVSVSLSDNAQTAYYNPVEDSITISYPLIAEVLDRCDDALFEENVRTLLYHEVSHALLTPKNMANTTARNIVEDERIESILREYYMGVNFRNFVKRLNNYRGEAPKTADEAFYHLVRYRVGDNMWLNRLHHLIRMYSGINRNSDYFNNYTFEVDLFYKQFVEWWNDQHKDEDDGGDSKPDNPTNNDTDDTPHNDNSSDDDSSDDDDDSGDDDSSDDDDSDDDDDSEDDDEIVDGDIPSDDGDDEDMADIDLESIFSDSDSQRAYDAEEAIGDIAFKGVFINVDKKLMDRLSVVLSNIKKFDKRNGSAINAYSGVFDPRSVVRDDYRYFVQKNRLGNIKAYSKTKLNLFIDRSGSFWDNVDRVNTLLKALADFEKMNSDFSFDLVTMGVGDTLMPRTNRMLKANGGNWLKKDIFDIFNKLQDKNANVYNIVLFDGDAFTDCRWDGGVNLDAEIRNFQAFNFKNVSIISDPSNRNYITPNCKNAHVIFTKKYTAELYDNVMAVLERIAR